MNESRALATAGRAREAVVVAILVALLTAALAAPVLLHPSERVFGNEIVGRHPDAYWAINRYLTPRLSTRSQPVTDLPPVPVARLIGPVAAFNVNILMSFPLAAAFTYLLAGWLGLGRVPAFLAALFFTFSAFHLSHAAYHPHITQIEWIPLYLLALWLCLEGWTAGRAVALVGTAGLLAFSNFYAGYFGAVLTPVAILAWWVAAPRTRRRRKRDLWLTVATLGAAPVIGIVWVVFFVPDVLTRFDELAWPRGDLHLYGARWWSYLVPPYEHPVFGEHVRAFWATRDLRDGVLEQQVGLGLALPLLAAVALWDWLRAESRPPALRAVPVLALVAATALLCSLPAADGAGNLRLRPAALLYRLAPMFRAHARFAVFLQLMLVLLAAIGLARLLARGRTAPRVAGVALVAVALFENVPYPPPRWHDVLPTSAHRWLASQPGPWRLLDCVSISHQREGPLDLLMPYPVSQLDEAVDDCGEPELAGKLAALGFTHMLLRPGSPAGDRLEAQGPPPGFELVASRDDGSVLRVTAPPAAVSLRPRDGFSWREYSENGSYRWMAESGEIEITNRAAESLRVVLHLELQAFAHPRRVEAALGSLNIGELRVSVERTEIRLGPLPIRPGTTALRLRSTDGATRPSELTGAGDTRPLSVALWGWRTEIAPPRPDATR